MTTRLITQPEFEPITLAEAKASIRQDSNAEDTLIASWIIAARRLVERELNRSLMRQTREEVLDDFPTDIELLYLPIQAIEGISYVDADGIDQAVPSADFSPDDLDDHERVRFWIKRAIGSDWPAVLADSVDSVRVRYRCGFSDSSDEAQQRAAVPEDIKQVIRYYVGIMDAHRSPLVVGRLLQDLPRSMFGQFLDPWRIEILR